MDYESELVRLERRVSELEYQLSRYHEWLEDSVDQRDKFTLDAAWGILQSGMPWLACFFVWFAFDRWINLDGLIWEIGAGILGLVTLGAVAVWQEGLREKDHKKLNRLPRWSEREKL